MDASNLNAAKHALALQGHVDGESRRVLEAISAPAFDTTMEREAQVGNRAPEPLPQGVRGVGSGSVLSKVS
jgi:hypothetical protein